MARSSRHSQAQGRRARRTVRTLVLATIMSVVGVLFSAGTASAVTPDCLRAGEPAGPCAQELEFPATFPTTPLRGMIMIIAGGGWQSTQPYLIGDGQYYRAASDRWLARGYAVAMVEHSDGANVYPNTPTGSQAFDNVLTWYDEYRTFWDGLAGYGAGFPICATGFSSGGHFALLLGAHRPTLDCVVAEGSPSRVHFKAKPGGAPSHAPGLPQEIQYFADLTFSGVQGVSPAPSWSPQTLRSQLRMPILIGHARNDITVLPSQTQTFCSKTFRNCRAVYLAGSTVGVVDFTHANVNDRALANFRNIEQRFVCSVVSSFSGPCP